MLHRTVMIDAWLKPEATLHDQIQFQFVQRTASGGGAQSVVGRLTAQNVLIPGGAVKKILVKDVGLDEDEARALV